MTVEQLMEVLSNAYGQRARVLNAAIDKANKFSKRLGKLSSDEKESILLKMLSAEHIYVQYWGAKIALSYEILKKEALTVLINILDIDPKTLENPHNLDLNILKMDIESGLYDYKKYKCIRSYPNQYSYLPSISPNAKRAIRYFRRYLKKLSR